MTTNEYLELEKRVKAIEEKIDNVATREDIEKIVHAALAEFFKKTGRGAKAAIITAATIIGSIVVIGGGFKWLLGVIGFEYVTK
jgi:tetrahydromethanopterin S-methyltransferase subunit G